MAFQIKNFASIVASMINRMSATQNKVTDFNVGAVGRTLIEAPAIEIDQLYQQMFNGLKEAIPVSIFTSFNFAPLSAEPASGIVTVTVTASPNIILIAAGTQFSSTNISSTYASTEDVTIPAGNTVASVNVAATTTGVATNCVADVSFTMTPSPSGFVSAINPTAFSNGADAETPAEQLIRFNAFIAALPRGTVAALKYGMSLANIQDSNGNIIEKVAFSSVVEPYLTDSTQPTGLVYCYIHNGVGNTSSALLTRTIQILFGYYDSNGNAIPGWQAAGVNVITQIATEVDVNVSGVITPQAGYVVEDQTINGVLVGLGSQAKAAVYAYLQNLHIGESALVAEIYALVMGITGVYNYLPTLPSADTSSTSNQKIMPGTITFTAATGYL